MSRKIEIPQELMNQIIDCYVNQQLSLQKTLVKLNLPFDIDVLKRLLCEQNIHIRTYKEAVGHGLRGPMPEEMANQVINLYNKGFSMERIQKELAAFYSTDKIKKTLLEHNIKLRTPEEAKQCRVITEERKYLVNDDYCLESHNGAWILGMFAADGYLPPKKNGGGNRLVLSLAKKDEEILHILKEELSYEGPINSYIASDGIHEFCSLSFTSKILREKFESYGIVNNKIFQLHSLPKLPDEFMLDYIRGYIDGDGSVQEYHGSPIIRITSACQDFLEDIAQYLEVNYNIPSKISPDNNVFCLRFGVEASKKLGHLIYDNDYLALPRKKHKFYEIITPTSLNTPQE